jgi:hypothetical protein
VRTESSAKVKKFPPHLAIKEESENIPWRTQRDFCRQQFGIINIHPLTNLKYSSISRAYLLKLRFH